MAISAALALAWIVSSAAPVAPAEEAPRPTPAEPRPLPSGWWDMGETTREELIRDVEEAGGVAFRADVPLHFLRHEEMVRYVGEVVDSEYPPDRASADERTLVAFDLLDPGTDLRALRRRLLEDNIAGFYDERPDRRKLYAVSDHSRLDGLNQLILAHELRHALQDQHIVVHDVLPASVGDFDDRRLAFLSLLEGDATLVMERVFLKKTGGQGERVLSVLSPPPPMKGTPGVLRDQLTLPYTIGHNFVRTLVERGGWEAVRSAWARPPASTEQVLHPEKYFDSEPPLSVRLPANPRGRRINEGVLGEAFIRTLLGAGTEEAAAGWGGDRFEVWDVSGRTLLVWSALWDTPKDADEFRQALLERYSRRHVDEGTRRGFRTFRNGLYGRAVRSRGNEVRVIASDHRRTFDRVLKEMAR